MPDRRQALKLFGLTAASPWFPLEMNIATPDKKAATLETAATPEERTAIREEKAAIPEVKARDFKYCINMATLRGHKLGFINELRIASKAGFTMTEIWMDSLQQYLDTGGKLSEAKKQLDGLGMTAVNAIGFAKWIVDDDAERQKGVEQMKREMGMLAQIGCKRVAAPPMGATDKPGLDLRSAAERYRVILQAGDEAGVVPQLELWGFSKNLNRLSEVMFVAIETGHPSARVLLDVYHLYKGGSGIETLPLVGKPAVEIIHMNDYPAKEPALITDADRVHPGDGIAPVKRILNILKSSDRPLILSEEVFNAAYYKQDPLEVAKTALNKMKLIVGQV